MKRILMICNYFAPRNEIASVRITKFAKYLREAGYTVDVITENPGADTKDTLLLDGVRDIPLHYAEEGKGYLALERFYKKFVKPLSDKKYADLSSPKRYYIDKATGRREFLPFSVAYPFWGTLDHILFVSRQKSIFRSVKQYLRDNAGQYDVCFSSYGEHFSHFCGLYVKKLCPNIRWIADFRDPVYQIKFNPAPTKAYAKRFEKRVYRACDRITMDTQSVIQLLPEPYRRKAVKITNGFDVKDRKGEPPQNLPSQFSFCYTGRMYGGLRKINRLFEAVASLIDEGKLSRDDVAFHYAGTGYGVFSEQAAAAGLLEQCTDHGTVSHEEAMSLQNSAMFLVLASWEFKAEPVGGLTGKVYEYMTAGTPIIALIDGDTPGTELTDVIRRGRLGFAYNEFDYSTDFEGLKAYLFQQYQRYKSGEPAGFSPEETVLAQFDYRNLTKRLITLIEDA